jgi:23S rRNA (cytosine1962-C5)-methyltransferase
MPTAETTPRRAKVTLLPGRDRPLRDGHPWLYSGAIAAEEGRADDPLVEVRAADGSWVGLGLYSPGSRIRSRILDRRDRVVDRNFFGARLDHAIELRRRIVPSGTDGYRVVNAEGDGLPGWTVDRFGSVLVSQITAAGLERLRSAAYEALVERFPTATVLHRGDLAARRQEGLGTADETISGAPAAAEVWFEESGLQFCAELAGGQKTGFYCDQRENRSRIAALAGDRSVLDLFGHSGAFSLYALRAGARRATLVESAGRLLDQAMRQAERNGIENRRLEMVEANVFEELRRREERFGIVICDPPPLARRRAHVDRAARAYKDLNRLALLRVEPGGFLATFSCSSAVDSTLFRQIFFAAAAEAGVRVQLLGPLAAAPDHPVAIGHLEGEYLKGWLSRVIG